MSEELTFTLKRNSSIRDLMDVFRAQFQKELRIPERRVTKYVFESDSKYLLIAENGNLTAAVLLQQDGGSWRALISPQRLWSKEVSFLVGEESFLAELERFFLEKSEDLITVVKPWTSRHEKGEPDQSGEDYVTPFYSELSEEGTLVHCPKCGAAEIIFPDRRTCSECGTEIVRKNSYFELNERKKEADVPPSAVQAGAAEVGRCIVCRMSIHRGEPLVYCPNCAGKAHRAHFLEYVHVKGECPSCHNHIAGDELKESVEPQQKGKLPDKSRNRVRRAQGRTEASELHEGQREQK